MYVPQTGPTPRDTSGREVRCRKFLPDAGRRQDGPWEGMPLPDLEQQCNVRGLYRASYNTRDSLGHCHSSSKSAATAQLGRASEKPLCFRNGGPVLSSLSLDPTLCLSLRIQHPRSACQSLWSLVKPESIYSATLHVHPTQQQQPHTIHLATDHNSTSTPQSRKRTLVTAWLICFAASLTALDVSPVGPPNVFLVSITATDAPSRAACTAAASPPGPDPSTIKSYGSSGSGGNSDCMCVCGFETKNVQKCCCKWWWEWEGSSSSRSS